VYSNWSEMIDELENRITKYKLNVLKVTGESIKNGDQLEDYKYKFQTNPDYKIIIGTIGKLGTGHTLTAADWVLFLDEPWTQADKDQAEDRAHRAGLKHCINIRTYLSKDTIDERVHDIVVSKGNLADYIVDGKPMPSKKMLNFLLNLEE
jgi:SNF2 family DNA or RNA helicase